MKTKPDIITNTFSVTMLADSVGPNAQRLTTMAVTLPRIILAELNTHRMFSRNAASSRAIPVKRMLENIENHPFIPLEFQKPHSGMQGKEVYTGEEHVECVRRHLLKRNMMVQAVEDDLNPLPSSTGAPHLPITKQLLNRYLEPWMWTTVIVSSTDWDNFFALRWTEHAEIHMRHITELMLKAYLRSTPEPLSVGEWHLPLFFIDTKDSEKYAEFVSMLDKSNPSLDPRCIVAAARCARVSYLNFDGEVSFLKDLALYEQLMSSGHMSPFEHVAMASDVDMCFGNFNGWIQLRTTVPNENRGFDYGLAAEQLYGGQEALPNHTDPTELPLPNSWSPPEHVTPPMAKVTHEACGTGPGHEALYAHDETPDAGLSTSGVEVFDEDELIAKQAASLSHPEGS